MWTQLLKSFFALGIFLIALKSFAATHLSLEDLRKEVLSENVDIRIQYEKYYQAQKGVSVALGEFLPSASISLININATLAILQSVIPTPSDWFAYQASQELRVAEKFTTESIKLNILEGLTVNYLNLKHQEILMVSLQEHEKFLAGIYEEVKKKEELGLASPHDVFLAKRNLMQHRQDIYALDTLMIAEKQSLLIAINRSPVEELILGDIPNENIEMIPETVEEGVELALKNSTELASNTYQWEAARFMVTSKKWSFISFNGIGFDYSSTLSIEKSKARVIELQREQIALKIKNQVYSAYHELSILDERISLQKRVVEESQKIHVRNEELYANEILSLPEYLESRSSYSHEERALVKLSMERKVKIAQIKRLLGMDSSLNNDDTDFDVLMSLEVSEINLRRGRHQIKMTLSAPEEVLSDVFSVEYSIEGLLNSGRSTSGKSGFSYLIKTKKEGTYTVKAKIVLISGDIIHKESVVVVD